jgi:hypothetical protein
MVVGIEPVVAGAESHGSQQTSEKRARIPAIYVPTYLPIPLTKTQNGAKMGRVRQITYSISYPFRYPFRAYFDLPKTYIKVDHPVEQFFIEWLLTMHVNTSFEENLG